MRKVSNLKTKLFQINDLDNIKDILKSHPFLLFSLNFRWEEVRAIPLGKSFFHAFNFWKKCLNGKKWKGEKKYNSKYLKTAQIQIKKKSLQNVGFKIFVDFPHSW